MAGSNAPPSVRALILVAGRVQGVGYRAFALGAASERRLCGHVKNLDDGRVELEAEGPKDHIESLIQDLKKGPPASRVTTVQVEWAAATGRFTAFRIAY